MVAAIGEKPAVAKRVELAATMKFCGIVKTACIGEKVMTPAALPLLVTTNRLVVVVPTLALPKSMCVVDSPKIAPCAVMVSPTTCLASLGMSVVISSVSP